MPWKRTPAVERAVVAPVTVEGLTELHGYVLARGEVTSATLRSHLRDRVPEAMVPARFFRLSSLPLTSSGKLDRKALAGAPLDRAESTQTATLPEVEAEVRAVWKVVLPGADPGPRDGFFDAGGNSLLVIRLHERLNARWPGVFGIADLFACATIAEQALRIAPDPPVPASPAPAAPPRTREAARTEPGHGNGANRHAIAVVGMAVRLAGSEDLAGFWRDVSHGADLVRAPAAGAGCGHAGVAGSARSARARTVRRGGLSRRCAGLRPPAPAHVARRRRPARPRTAAVPGDRARRSGGCRARRRRAGQRARGCLRRRGAGFGMARSRNA